MPVSWSADREQRRAARERERIRREFADLDRRYGHATRAGEVPQAPRQRSGCLSGLLQIVAILAAIAVGMHVFGPGLSRQGVVDFAEHVRDTVTQLQDPEFGWVYDDGADGHAHSGGDGYTFTALQPDGVSPATWPCRGTIAIEVNPEGAPAGYETFLASSIARINAASGFTFEITGETTDRNFLQRSIGPVLLGFSDEDELEALGGRIAGLGGAVYARPSSGGPVTAVGGVVALDTDVFTDRLPREHAEAITMHELAHVLGLGHTDQRGQLMAAYSTSQTDFGEGDLAGLAALRDQACS